MHIAPAAHGEHAPILQTLSVPHEVPSVTFIPVSTQLTDGEQTVVPAWHALAGTHESPAMHVTQVPPLHTLSLPHGVPVGVLPDSMHTGEPVLHAVVPVRQGLLAIAQLDPATHATHMPVALQTWS